MGWRALRWLDTVATPRRILWLGWLLFVVYCYPGYMSTDSVDQLLQAREVNELHDWYPPVMAILWRATDTVIAGPFPMLVLQSVAFLLGANGILRHVTAPRPAAIVASCVLLFPPVLTTMGVIWKDSQMAGFLLAGIACLLSASRRWRIAGCVLLCLATAQRYNAPAATLPIVVVLFTWRGGEPWLRRYAIAAAVWLAITLVAFGANRALGAKKTYAWHGSVALFDIVGMIRYTPNLSDEEIRERLSGMTIVPTTNLHHAFKRSYNPRAWWWIANGDRRVLEAPRTEEQRLAVSHAWWDLATTYPQSYLRHRWRVFKSLLRLGEPRANAEWDGFTEMKSQEDMIGHRATHSKLQKTWLSVIPKIDDWVVFRPWAHLLVALLLLPLCRQRRLAFVMFASGILYELSSFVAAPSTDYRYSHWLIACTTIGAAMVFAARWREGRSVLPT